MSDKDRKKFQSYLDNIRVQPSSAERLGIGIKLTGVAPTGRFEASGSWNNMVTGRMRISDPKQIDKEALAWLKRAYDAA